MAFLLLLGATSVPGDPLSDRSCIIRSLQRLSALRTSVQPSPVLLTSRLALRHHQLEPYPGGHGTIEITISDPFSGTCDFRPRYGACARLLRSHRPRMLSCRIPAVPRFQKSPPG